MLAGNRRNGNTNHQRVRTKWADDWFGQVSIKVGMDEKVARVF